MTRRLPLAILLPVALPLASVLFSGEARAQNYEILDQKLNAAGEGYTVVRVWGSRQEIGHAIGVAFADDIAKACNEVRVYAGSNYVALRSAMGLAGWLPNGVGQEFDGIAEGVKSVRPNALVDGVDMKVLNTFGDWAYACRSHSCWGSRAQAPYTTLSTRRLDFGSPFSAVHHHVLYAVEPTDEPGRWVNLAWPGFISVVTGVNEHGTLVSVHDFNSSVVADAGVLSRSMAARHLLTSVPSTPVAGHLSWAQQQLSSQRIATGTFLNFYAPDGHGGVFTCAPGAICTGPRLPQNDYLGGEVLITTNSQTDGHSTPSGASYLDPYYQQPGPKTPESHFDVMINDELHMMTVGFRGPEDMRLLAHGRTNQGWTPRIDVEWSTLFPSVPVDAGTVDSSNGDAEPLVDAEPFVDASTDGMGEDGSAATDGGSGGAGGTAGSGGAAGTAGGGKVDSSDDGCGCSVPGRPSRAGWVLALLLGFALRRGRRDRFDACVALPRS
jgi:MYXO-CTERM domain-containing protein